MTSRNASKITGRWMAIGIAIGAALGVVLDNIPIGIALGLVVGLVIGSVQAKNTPPEKNDHTNYKRP